MTSNLTFRRSTQEDSQEIDELLKECFGAYIDDLENYIVDRYLCAVDNGKIVAVTGILQEDKWFRTEVDFSVVYPSYRGQHLMSHMIAQELQRVGNIDVFCSCWRVHSSINLIQAMRFNGFKEIKRPEEVWPRDSDCEGCISSDECNGCCYADLWLRKAKAEQNTTT